MAERKFLERLNFECKLAFGPTGGEEVDVEVGAEDWEEGGAEGIREERCAVSNGVTASGPHFSIDWVESAVSSLDAGNDCADGVRREALEELPSSLLVIRRLSCSLPCPSLSNLSGNVCPFTSQFR